VDADLDTLATAVCGPLGRAITIAPYVTIDDAMKSDPRLCRLRPEVGLDVQLSDAELCTIAVIQSLLGFTSEARFPRWAGTNLVDAFPYLPNQPGYNKRLRAAAGQMRALVRMLAMDSDLWDDVWVVDSTPVECGRSRPTAKRSDLAGFAGYGYCASHSRYFWSLRLHLVCTPAGLPITFALSSPKTDEREVLRDLLEVEPELLGSPKGQVVIADKGYASAELETFLAHHGVTLLRPSKVNEAPRPGARLLKPLRQLIESVVAVIWHNRHTRKLFTRSLIAYDH
jgi:hypothetical protein